MSVGEGRLRPLSNPPLISDDSAMSFGAGNLLQSLGLLFLYAVVVVTIVYKAFTLIFIGPDRAIDVLGWKVLQSGIEDTEWNGYPISYLGEVITCHNF